jgi:hypothetical protein
VLTLLCATAGCAQIGGGPGGTAVPTADRTPTPSPSPTATSAATATPAPACEVESAAAALVAGVAALGVGLDCDAERVRTALLAAARDAATDGPDPATGHGVVAPARTVRRLDGPAVATPGGDDP